MPHHAACPTLINILRPPIAGTSKRLIQLSADERFDEPANPIAHTDLDRIKPVVEKMAGGLSCRSERISDCGSVRHGVVSVPALQRRLIRASTRRLRQPNSNHFRYGTEKNAGHYNNGNFPLRKCDHRMEACRPSPLTPQAELQFRRDLRPQDSRWVGR